MRNCFGHFADLRFIVVAGFVCGGCRAAPPVEKHAAPATDTPDAGVDGGDEYVARCVAKEDDVVSFVLSLPELEAQRRYAQARGKSSREIRIIIEDSPRPGCRSSKFSPRICDWSLLVTGPLFRARYFIHPAHKQINVVDTLPYEEWCKSEATDAAQWWPAKPDCAHILDRADEEISPGGGDCLP